MLEVLQLRQVALVTAEYDKTVADIGHVLDSKLCFSDPTVEVFGLRNALFAFGGAFLEVVSPIQANTTAGRLLQKRHGDGGYMVMLETNDVARDKARAQAEDVPVVLDIDTGDCQGVHLHPKRLGALLSFDQMMEAGLWKWAGPHWRDLAGSSLVDSIRGVVVQVLELEATARLWGALLGRAGQPVPDGWQLAVGDSFIRLVEIADERGPGVKAVFLDAKQPDEILSRAGERGLPLGDHHVVLAGCEFRF